MASGAQGKEESRTLELSNEDLICLLALSIGDDKDPEAVEIAYTIAKSMREDPTSAIFSKEEAAIVDHLLGSIGYSQYAITGRMEYLTEAIEYQRDAALDTTSISNYHMRRTLLAKSLFSRFLINNKSEDLEEALSIDQDSLRNISSDEARRKELIETFDRVRKAIGHSTNPIESLDSLEALTVAFKDATALILSSTSNRVDILHSAAAECLADFNRTGFRRDLEEAIRSCNLALSIPTATDAQQRNLMTMLLSLLYRRFKITESTADFKATINFLDHALNIVKCGHLRVTYMASKAHLLTENYRRHFIVKVHQILDLSGIPDKFEAAFKALDDAKEYSLQSLVGSDVDTQIILAYCTAALLGDRFLASPTVDDWSAVLDSGLFLVQNFKGQLSDGTPIFTSNAIQDKKYREEVMKKMQVQISRLRTIVQQSEKFQSTQSSRNPDLRVEVSQFDPMAKKILVAIHEKYTTARQAKMGHEFEALDYLHEALAGHVIVTLYADDMAPLGGKDCLPDLGRALEDFGMTEFQVRFRLSLAPRQDVWAKNNFNDWLTKHQEAEDAKKVLWEHQVEALEAAAYDHLKRFLASQNPSDLDVALSSSEHALHYIPVESDGPLRVQLTILFIKIYLLADLGPSSVSNFEKAMHFAELAHFLVSSRVNKEWFNLLKSLISRVREGLNIGIFSLSQLDQIIDVGARVFTLALDDKPNLRKFDGPAELPFLLALSHKTRYRNNGDDQDLDASVRLATAALSLSAQVNDPSNLIVMRVEYAMILKMLYERTRSLSDLNRALDILEEVDNDSDLDLPFYNRFAIGSNRILLLQEKYTMTKDEEYLNLAIELGELGLAKLMSFDLKDQGTHFQTIQIGYLCNTANAISSRHSITKDPLDLDEALQYMAEAISLISTSPDYTRRGTLNHDFTVLVLRRYEDRKNDQDLHLAHQLLKETLDLLPAGHPLRGWCLIKFADCLTLEKAPDSEIRQAYADAWACTSMATVMRVNAAHSLAKFNLADGDIIASVLILKDAVDLLPNLEPGWIQNSNWTWKACLELPAATCILGLRSGWDAYEALALLEKGRGRTLGSIIDFRDEVDAHPEHGLMEDSVENLNYYRMRGDSAQSAIEKRRYKEAVHNIISNEPEFKDLLSPTPERYMKLAQDGAIVTIMTSELADPGIAIIVTSTRIYDLTLEGLHHNEMTEKMRDLAENIIHGEDETWSSRNKQLAQLLGWLWITIVEPILRELGYSSNSSSESLPSIRWVGVGLLSNAPFHAAGIYAQRSSSYSALDYVISSYAPSIRALLYTSQRKKRIFNPLDDGNILIVKVPEAEGEAPLIHVEGEIKAVTEAASRASMQVNIMENPTGPDVLKQLPLYNLIHFACHGFSDPTDPTKGYLLLPDGELSVDQLMEAFSSRPDLAFLSACSTAKGQGIQVVDESLHIASAFMMIGFRHVIGTLWNAPDRACKEVAQKFYPKLFEGGRGAQGRSLKVAEALHFSIKELKALTPKSPLVWATFVAFGM